MFNNSRSQNPTLQFQTDFQLQDDILSERVGIENLLSSLNISIKNLNNNSDINYALNKADNTLISIQLFLQNLAFSVNKLSTNSTISQATLTLWKANVSTARVNIAIAMNNLSVTIGQYQSALSALNVSNSQLVLIKTSATKNQIKVEEATVEEAQANVDAAQANLSKSVITSPISGVITNINAKVGQTIQSGITAISVISYGQYDVEAFIPEADIAKIKIGNIATTTLDAYGSDTFFQTSVMKIDPGETILENVPTYKITLKFASSSDNRIKSGMTANLDILTAQKENALVVPSRSVYTLNNTKYVKSIDQINNKKITEIKVETGIRGVDGYVEIISGLKEGDKIVASPNI
jgi:multidrug efflux pump subunit AcrA (membrane-fusion protein)